MASPPTCRRRAHPRSRGENSVTALFTVMAVGSSPLTRGKPDWRRRRLVGAGLIPAHAGKTSSDSSSAPSARAHPRSRGENEFRRIEAADRPGSSPLTRGKLDDSCTLGAETGLIPAHAGKTGSRPVSSGSMGAHPRSRGENASCASTSPPILGSSPLTRGKHTSGREDPWRRGLIPAHAGKTPDGQRYRMRSEAHPRSRGENLIGVAADLSAQGSSPLTRGKQDEHRRVALGGGLIPAHAGKTPTKRPSRSSARAHPRSRGENTQAAGSCPTPAGSSPLTRGKPALGGLSGLSAGLIPAHAGKTSSADPSATTTAHPRSRGENVIGQLLSAVGEGSSPLTRGKRISPN